ncbi:hypothetical protein CCP3SC1AL1_4610002 [Gammaproteobacteria bacterium]
MCALYAEALNESKELNSETEIA